MATPSELRRFVSDRLCERAQDLVDRWIERLSKRLGPRPVHLLPTETLRNHFPALLQRLGRGLLLPEEHLANETIDELRLVAQLRREQGYDIQELLVEFEILTRLLFEEFERLVQEFEGSCDAEEAVAISGSMSLVLTRLASVAVGTYRDEELFERQETSRRISEFAASLAHEMRNPLQLLTTKLELLRSDEVAADAEERERYIDELQRGLGRLSDLVLDAESLAHTERGRAATRQVSLRSAITSCLEELRETADRRKVRLELEDPIPEVQGDAAHLAILFGNLVGNAIKYADDGKQERWCRISVAETEESPLWMLIVADNGIGIPEGFRPHVFRRFVRAQPEVADGTGLGLAIVRQTLELVGGRIEVESRVGEGSTFRVVLPLESQTDEAGKVER